MAMTVEILIKGTALCYDKDRFWNIVFIGDDIHQTKFYEDGNEHPRSPLMIEGRTRKIAFDIGNSPFSNPVKGADFRRIFNMAERYAHGPGKLNVDPGGNTGKIRMQVPSASLNAKELTERDYFVQDASRPGSPPLLIDPVAKVITAKFEVTDQENGLVMRIEETGQPSIDIHFPYREGRLELIFDNDCGRYCRQNDFVHYYDWVQDTDGKRVYAGQVKPRGIRLFAEDEELEKNGFDLMLRSPNMGNCDPVGSDPPPGP